MVEKYNRKRSKSAPRKRRSGSNSSPKPIISNKEKSFVVTKLKEKSAVKEQNFEKRITRRRKLLVESDILIVDKEEVVKKTLPISKPISAQPEIKQFETSTFSFSLILYYTALYFLILILIPLVIILNKMCENGGKINFFHLSEIRLEYFIDCHCIGFVVLWLIYLAIMAHFPMGKSIIYLTNDDEKKKYRCNGIITMVLSMVLLSGLIYSKHVSTNVLLDNYYFIIGSSITVSIIMSLILLITSHIYNHSQMSFYPRSLLKNFVLGFQDNPRFFDLDMKLFYEFRPGFVGWALINIIYCVKDLEDNKYNSINYSLLLSACGQIIYCVDALLFESDIISKPFLLRGKFGYFHCFGNQVIVPFMFTLTTRAIQINKYELPLKCLAGIVVINIIGYIIYRSSNTQKNNFRQNPYNERLYHLKTLTNNDGHQILVGGWWGILRHPNYLGDILMTLSWSLCAGFHFTVCWLYPIYFFVFIVTRCLQDDHKCALEHGDTWNKYRRLVPYRLIPFLF